MLFPRWFRALVIAAATVILCACQSTSPDAPHSSISGHSQLGASEPPRPAFPIQQAEFASQQWVDKVPTQPYDGPVVPCSCHGCQPDYPITAGSEPFGACPTGECGTCASCEAIGPPDEYLCDGGDFHTPAGVRHDWQIEGLEQEDTISHYDTLDGRVIVKPSNRVCIYAPRFGAVRRVENLSVNHHRVGPGGIIDEMGLATAGRVDEATTSLQQHAPLASLGDQPPNMFRAREQAGGVRQRIAAADLETFLAPQMALEVVKLGVIDNSEKPRLAKAIVSAYQWASDVSAQVVIDGKQAHQQIGRTQAGEIYGLELPDSPKIRLIKLASTGAAQIGEEVEFTLRFDNVGDQPIGNVTIVDNLATRLEYVPDSAKASVDANFTTEPNEGGSVVLRWEIAQPLKPGEGGVLSFKARVR
jgi:uncharacterized repeat protein (TIGR01451 family)